MKNLAESTINISELRNSIPKNIRNKETDKNKSFINICISFSMTLSLLIYKSAGKDNNKETQMTTTANDEGDQRPIGFAGHDDKCKCKQCKNKKGTKNIMNKMIRRKNLVEDYKGGKIRIKFKVLKDNEKPLTPEERAEVMSKKATWHHGPKGAPSPAVWKSVVKDETYYITNTHRAYNITRTLKGTIARYHDFIKGTA